MKKVLCVLLLLYSGLDLAAGSIVGPVEYYWTDSLGFYFQISGNITSKPSCSQYSRFVVPVGSAEGISITNQIINAKNTKLTVTVLGTGACTLTGADEDVHYIAISGTPSPN